MWCHVQLEFHRVQALAEISRPSRGALYFGDGFIFGGGFMLFSVSLPRWKPRIPQDTRATFRLAYAEEFVRGRSFCSLAPLTGFTKRLSHQTKIDSTHLNVKWLELTTGHNPQIVTSLRIVLESARVATELHLMCLGEDDEGFRTRSIPSFLVFCEGEVCRMAMMRGSKCAIHV